jgi:hypothetical protein
MSGILPAVHEKMVGGIEEQGLRPDLMAEIDQI